VEHQRRAGNQPKGQKPRGAGTSGPNSRRISLPPPIEDLARPFYQALDFDEESVPVRYWPMGCEVGILLDPNRCFGQPIDERTGAPTRVLYEMAQGGYSAETIAWRYELNVAVVRGAVAFESRLRQ
jgi:uncharacterized protein (DUF433 family)